MSEVLLTLMLPPSLEEPLLDLLLLNPEVKVFTSTDMPVHGVSFGRLSPNEQVLGRLDAVQVQVLLVADRAAELLSELRRHFAGAGLRYWLTPVLDSGDIE